MSYGAVIDGEIVAVYSGGMLVVHPEHRRKGIGTTLYKKLGKPDDDSAMTW